MASLLTACARIVALGAVAALPTAVLGVVPYQPNGVQYPLVGQLPGDQTKPQVAVNRHGGYVVWQDNVTDSQGLGISARRLDPNFSGDRNVFRVNEGNEGDQENPQVVLLRDGGAVFVWQSGVMGQQDIHARFIGADNTFTTGDITVNTYRDGQQADPVVASLNDGSIVVVWSSHEQDGSMQGLFGQRLDASGQKLGEEFQVSQVSQWNQRQPSLAPLANGNYVVTWINETGSDVIGAFQVTVQGRLFGSNGPAGNEFQVNGGTNVCSTPSVAGMTNGGFMVAWAQQTAAHTGNGWDIYSRAFDSAGTPRNFGPRINAETYGDQYLPRVAGGGEECMLLWTSMGQDGSREGVYARFVTETGAIYSEEFRVNAMTASRQIHSVVTSDGDGQFLAVWSTFVGGIQSFDLYGQRFQADRRPVPTPEAPFINALSATELLISWAEQTGLDVQGYDLYVDGAETPVRVTENSHVLTGLTANSTHSVKLTYQLADGRISPESPVASGRTWGVDTNNDSLPDDWQQDNWGKPINWPSPGADSDGDGATNEQEFLAGTDPTNPDSVLRVRFERNETQRFLNWNCTPGAFYQVESAPAVEGPWNPVGSRRFANGPGDSLPIEGSEAGVFYRVIRLR